MVEPGFESHDGRLLESWLKRRPLPRTLPDVRPAVMARVWADLARSRQAAPRWAAPAWCLAGVLVGLLFLVALQGPGPRVWSASMVENAPAELLPEDVTSMMEGVPEIPVREPRP